MDPDQARYILANLSISTIPLNIVRHGLIKLKITSVKIVRYNMRLVITQTTINIAIIRILMNWVDGRAISPQLEISTLSYTIEF